MPPLSMTRPTRPISWIKAAKKDFEEFPKLVRDDALEALSTIADGGTSSLAKPLTCLGSGVMELVLRERGDAFRVVYALQLEAKLWVVHAFQKKSKVGIKTPKAEIDLVRERLKRLKEALS